MGPTATKTEYRRWRHPADFYAASGTTAHGDREAPTRLDTRRERDAGQALFSHWGTPEEQPSGSHRRSGLSFDSSYAGSGAARYARRHGAGASEVDDPRGEVQSDGRHAGGDTSR